MFKETSVLRPIYWCCLQNHVPLPMGMRAVICHLSQPYRLLGFRKIEGTDRKTRFDFLKFIIMLEAMKGEKDSIFSRFNSDRIAKDGLEWSTGEKTSVVKRQWIFIVPRSRSAPLAVMSQGVWKLSIDVNHASSSKSKLKVNFHFVIILYRVCPVPNQSLSAKTSLSFVHGSSRFDHICWDVYEITWL